MKIGGKTFTFIGTAETNCEAEGIACKHRKIGCEVRIKRRKKKGWDKPCFFIYTRMRPKEERAATIEITEDQARVIRHGLLTVGAAELDSMVTIKEIEAIIEAAFPRLRKMKGDRV
jgi:hypothetical protein